MNAGEEKRWSDLRAETKELATAIGKLVAGHSIAAGQIALAVNVAGCAAQAERPYRFLLETVEVARTHLDMTRPKGEAS